MGTHGNSGAGVYFNTCNGYGVIVNDRLIFNGVFNMLTVVAPPATWTIWQTSMMYPKFPASHAFSDYEFYATSLEIFSPPTAPKNAIIKIRQYDSFAPVFYQGVVEVSNVAANIDYYYTLNFPIYRERWDPNY